LTKPEPRMLITAMFIKTCVIPRPCIFQTPILVFWLQSCPSWFSRFSLSPRSHFSASEKMAMKLLGWSWWWRHRRDVRNRSRWL